MPKEIEQKFIWEESQSAEQLAEIIDAYHNSRTTIVRSVFVREFEYFDTPNRDLLQNGETIRAISGFPNNLHKVDYKKGKGYNRDEIRFTLVEKPSIGIIEHELDISPLELQCQTTTFYNRTKIMTKQFSYFIELAHVFLENGKQFSELEVEYKGGELKDFDSWCSHLQESMNLTRHENQKYETIMRM